MVACGATQACSERGFGVAWLRFEFHTVDGCEILHHQRDGWKPANNGIKLSINWCGISSTVGFDSHGCHKTLVFAELLFGGRWTSMAAIICYLVSNLKWSKFTCHTMIQLLSFKPFKPDHVIGLNVGNGWDGLKQGLGRYPSQPQMLPNSSWRHMYTYKYKYIYIYIYITPTYTHTCYVNISVFWSLLFWFSAPIPILKPRGDFQENP